MSFLKKFLIDPLTAKTNLSNLDSVNLANSSRRFKTSADSIYQEIETLVSVFERRISSVVPNAHCRGDLVYAIPPGGILQGLQEALLQNQGGNHQYDLLKHRVKKLMKSEEALTEYVRSGKASSLVLVYLTDGAGARAKLVRTVHGLALKTGMDEDEYNSSRLMGLYSSSLGDFGGTPEYPEKIFKAAIKAIGQKDGRKGIMLYNSMMFVYSKCCPWKAEALFNELVKRCRPTVVTFRAFLHALSSNGESDKASEYVELMKEKYELVPQFYHYGAVVDAYARKQTSKDIKKAVEIVMNVREARHQWAINAILSRAFIRVLPTTEAMKKEVDDTMEACQLLVDFLDHQKFHYAVLMDTHRRLEEQGLKWPKSVAKMEELE